MRFSLVLGVGVGLLLAAAPPSVAQRFPAFGGIEGRAGAVFPSNASTGISASADVDLGYVGSPVLRTIVGGNFFRADTERGTGDGSFSAVGGRLGLRFDPLGAGRFTPYVLAAVTGHNVSSDIPGDEQYERLLGGFVVGASVAGGLTYALDEAERLAFVAEGRRVFVNNIAHWGVELGIRLTPLGRRAYAAAPRRLDLYRDDRRDGRAVDAAVAAERARAEAERARLEAEARRARGEVAQQTEVARREADEAQRRAQELEADRQREVQARQAAEAEAADARAQAEAAERRAAEAEGRLLGALQDLDRLINNVTSVRETERGLVVTLGQGLFASGQASLSAQTRAEVGRIAAVLTQYPDRNLLLEGHTDSVGSEVNNQNLSERRAEAVRAALIAEGIDPSRVSAVGYGQTRPIASNATAAGRAQNRRVEIVIPGARRPGAGLIQ